MAEVTIPEALSLAASHQSAGRLADAEAVYREILKHQPHNAEAIYQLGMIASQVGRNDLAAELIRRGIGLLPAVSAKAYANLGNALYRSGRLEEAIDAYARGVQIEPDF